MTNYPANLAIFGANSKNIIRVWYWNSTAGYAIGNIPDGTSSTVAFAEKYASLNGAPRYNTPPGNTQAHGCFWTWPSINSVTSAPVFNYEGTSINSFSWTYQTYVTNSNNFI